MLRSLTRACVVVLVAALAGGCGGDASKADFQEVVLVARNDTDAGLAQIVEATSKEDLFARMRIAAVDVRRASTHVREADAPREFRNERDELAAKLLALSDEIIATADTLEAFPDQAAKTKALSFEQWDAVQEVLAELRDQGIEVPLLERHKPTAELQAG